MTAAKDIADLFSTLSVESRLKILLLLRNRRLCVGALSHALGITPGAVSQHLRLLRHAGFVTDCKCGNFVHYEIDRKSLNDLVRRFNRLFAADGEDKCIPEASGRSSAGNVCPVNRKTEKRRKS